MDQRFGFYQFLSRHVQDQIRAATYGAALMQINIRDVKRLRFLCPNLAEQAAIVERIEAIAPFHESLMDACHLKLTEIDALRQSLLQKAFSGGLT